MPNIKIPTAALQVDKKELTKILKQAGRQVKNTAIELINSGSDGAPKSRTGQLADSMRLTQKKGIVKVTDDAPYALALEAGGTASKRSRMRRDRNGKFTKDKSAQKVDSWVLPAHPYLSTALEIEENNNLAERIGEALLKGIKLSVK